MQMHCVDLPKYSHVDSTTVRINIENFCLVLLTPDKCNMGVFTRKYTTCVRKVGDLENQTMFLFLKLRTGAIHSAFL